MFATGLGPGKRCSDGVFEPRDDAVNGREHLLALAGQIVDGTPTPGSGPRDRSVESGALEHQVRVLQALDADLAGPAGERHEVGHRPGEVLVIGGKI